MASNHRVVVVAASIEGIDALARLTNGLQANFPAPVVAYVRGMPDDSTDRLIHQKLNVPSTLKVVFAHDGETLRAGYFYIAPVGQELTFTGVNTLGCAPPTGPASADRLFESAAFWHGAGTLAVVLSGLGDDGVRGFTAITDAGGIRVVQSPCEASFAAMPSNALRGDHVQYSVVLDQMMGLLHDLMAPAKRTNALF